MSQVLDLRHFTGPLAGLSQKTQHEVLWYQGNLELLQMPLASVVGTREVSPEGIARTKRLTALLVEEGFCVVSGLAKGVDRVAHEVALQMDGYTIAVMGTPIDDCYPKENGPLKNEISRRGLILSQFEPHSPILRSNFPRRNILMAALSSATFVVEAGLDSGTKHQVKAAVERGKPVAFLASLVDRDYPWVRDALDSGFGFVIEQPEDAHALLRRANIQSAPSISPVTQGHFDMFQQFADESRANIAPTNKAPVEQQMLEAVRPVFRSEIIPEEDQAHLALILPSVRPKPSWWEKVWDWFLGVMPHREA
jgi:DNA processing protein